MLFSRLSQNEAIQNQSNATLLKAQLSTDLNHWNIDQVSFIDTQTKAEASQNTEQNLNFSPLQFESAKRALPFSFPNLDSVL